MSEGKRPGALHSDRAGEYRLNQTSFPNISNPLQQDHAKRRSARSRYRVDRWLGVEFMENSRGR